LNGKCRRTGNGKEKEVIKRKIGIFFDTEPDVQEQHVYKKYVRGINDMVVWDITKDLNKDDLGRVDISNNYQDEEAKGIQIKFLTKNDGKVDSIPK
jgi:hypothetical protein